MAIRSLSQKGDHKGRPYERRTRVLPFGRGTQIASGLDPVGEFDYNGGKNAGYPAAQYVFSDHAAMRGNAI